MNQLRRIDFYKPDINNLTVNEQIVVNLPPNIIPNIVNINPNINSILQNNVNSNIVPIKKVIKPKIVSKPKPKPIEIGKRISIFLLYIR